MVGTGRARPRPGLVGPAAPASTKEGRSVSTGESIRLQRLFDGGRNAIVVAIDHGLYNGPRPGFEDLSSVVGRLGSADAILLSPGMVPHVRSVFEHRGAPAMILRLNWGTQYATQWAYHESRSVSMI